MLIIDDTIVKSCNFMYLDDKKKRILITGATGYLGSNIINTLKDKYEFVLLKRQNSNLKRIECLEDFQIIDIDNFDIKLVKELDIDILLHCATHYGRKNIDSVNTIEANLLLPLHLLSLFQKAGRSIKFINTDTILDKHINVYSLSKSQFKEWMLFFSDDIVFINIKLEHFYGPLDDKTKFVSYLINSFLNNDSYIDLTKGEQKRYFTYIDDIVSAFDVIISKIDQFNKGLTEFHVSSDEPVNLKVFVNLVKHVTGNLTTTLNWGKIPYRNGELMDFLVDSSKIKILGWQPKVSLTDGIKKTYLLDKQHL
ncbi:MAG: NAD(P)-dependent oxidoreductase [Sphingobacteriaceae bacterium]|nr:MAG: NAD(P)-dependent oxidoreductase [Sphingobacteriaceae bacterium]